MKGIYSTLIFLLLIIMILSPLRVLNADIKIENGIDGTGSLDYFLVKNSKDGEIEKIAEKEYIIGVLAGEMSPDSHIEALKSQAVASYTYALYKREKRVAENGEFDLTDSPDTDQNYISKAGRVALWQENYDKNEKVLEGVADSVYGEAVTFGGKPILALYHSVSSGKTENNENVFGGVYPYLSSVESSYDLLSPNYLSSVTYDSKEFAERALKLGITLVGEPNSWLTEPERTATGYVTSYTLAGHKFTGREIRSAFELKSSNFDLVYENGKFKFTARGNGHGVGMSQYGAVHMASVGSNYKEILVWYYQGTEIKKIK